MFSAELECFEAVGLDERIFAVVDGLPRGFSWSLHPCIETIAASAEAQVCLRARSATDSERGVCPIGRGVGEAAVLAAMTLDEAYLLWLRFSAEHLDVLSKIVRAHGRSGV